MNATKLIERLKTAVTDKDAAKVRWEEARTAVLAAHKEYKLHVANVDEIQKEIVTGEPARPMLDVIEEKEERKAAPKDFFGHATRKPPPPDVPVTKRPRERPDARTAGDAERATVSMLDRHLADVERAADVPETIVPLPPNDVGTCDDYHAPRTFVPTSNADRQPVRAAKTDGIVVVGDDGPTNEQQALGRALAMGDVRDALTSLVARGDATDDEIFRVLVQWPVHRVRSARDPRENWGTIGGSKPGFFYGHDCRDGNWPNGTPTLEGDALLKAARKYLAIKRPITAREAKATFHEPTAATEKTTSRWTVKKIIEAIKASEGEAGDGTQTVVCKQCWAARPHTISECPRCGAIACQPIRDLEPVDGSPVRSWPSIDKPVTFKAGGPIDPSRSSRITPDIASTAPWWTDKRWNDRVPKFGVKLADLRDDVDRELYLFLTMNRFFESRFGPLRKRETTDEEIDVMIRRGGPGGFYPGSECSRPGNALKFRKGGPIKFWAGDDTAPNPDPKAQQRIPREPDLVGKAVIDRVRAILSIPDREPTPALDRHFAEEDERKRQRTAAATAASLAARARRKTAAAVATAETDGPKRTYGSNPRRSGAARRKGAAIPSQLRTGAAFAAAIDAAGPDRSTKPKRGRTKKFPLAIDRKTPFGRQTIDKDGRVVAVPMAGSAWDNADLCNAAEDLGCTYDDLVICNRCNRARRMSTHPCPCGGSEYRIPGAVHVHTKSTPVKPKKGAKTRVNAPHV
jgi:hypothetical protein